MDEGRDISENVNSVGDIDSELKSGEQVIQIQSEGDYTLIEEKRNKTQNTERSKIDLLKEKIDILDDAIASDNDNMPVHKEPTFKYQSKLCSRLSYDCEKNKQHTCCKDSKQNKAANNKKQNQDQIVLKHSKAEEIVTKDKTTKAKQIETKVSLFQVFEKLSWDT